MRHEIVFGTILNIDPINLYMSGIKFASIDLVTASSRHTDSFSVSRDDTLYHHNINPITKLDNMIATIIIL